MFFDSMVVTWGFFFFSSGFFCICLPRKFMGLKAKVCFTGDMGLGFVFCWRLIIRKNTEHEHVLPKKRETKLIENLFFSF